MGQQKLTKAEEEVMMLLWTQMEPVTVSQLIEQMSVEPRPPHSTISTIIRTLERKGFVDEFIYDGTMRMREEARQTLTLVKKAMGVAGNWNRITSCSKSRFCSTLTSMSKRG